MNRPKNSLGFQTHHELFFFLKSLPNLWRLWAEPASTCRLRHINEHKTTDIGNLQITRLLNIFNTEAPIDEKVYWLLRIAVTLCFLGHGFFGFIIDDGKIGKVAWLVFYEPFGIGPEMVYKYYLMPLIGVMDILVALATLFVPTRCVWAYAVFWCIFTAFLRPLTGQGFAELFERGGNYGPPLALAVYCGLHFRSIKDWFSLLDPPK